MGEFMSSLLSVTIDFDQSHLFFPTLVFWVLVVLFALIVISKWRNVRAGFAEVIFSYANADYIRLFGTVALLVLYFMGMTWIGDIWPNSGLGFLFSSIVFIFALAMLYAHAIDRRVLMFSTVTAIVAPLFTWYVLGNLFNLTLP